MKIVGKLIGLGIPMAEAIIGRNPKLSFIVSPDAGNGIIGKAVRIRRIVTPYFLFLFFFFFFKQFVTGFYL